MILIIIIRLTSLLKLNFSNRMKTFRFSFFNRHRVLQKISQFLNPSLMIFKTYLISIAPAKSARAILRAPPFYLTFELI